ncbi:MAG: hypothetical protein JWL59_4365 [Chthoniobacteraceae bacterium]|nr:hypothetical protein [Chthoniobacteraceae bacterium]
MVPLSAERSLHKEEGEHGAVLDAGVLTSSAAQSSTQEVEVRVSLESNFAAYRARESARAAEVLLRASEQGTDA